MDRQPTVSSVVDYISCLSFNPTGLNDVKANLINTILISHDIKICTIQEHFLLDKNLHRLKKYFPQYEIFSLSAYKNTVQINSGRPSGGLAFLYHPSLSKFISRVTCPNSYRVQGLKLNLPNDPYIFINCYFPVDNRNDVIDDLINVLQDIKYIVDSCEPNCKVVLLGDLNADFSRDTAFVTFLKDFLTENNLCSVWSKFDCDFTYSFTRLVNGVERTFFSTIDHFCTSPEMLPSCTEAATLHFVENMSNHEPIFLKFKCVPSNIETVSDKNSRPPPKPVWKKAEQADIDSYKFDLEHILSEVIIPDCVTCANVCCVCTDHIDQIDNYALQIMESISSAVDNNIPFSNPNPKKALPMPGWSDYVKPFKDDAFFWHSIWKSAGRPQNCQLHTVMKSTRNKYHFAIRKVRKHEKLIRKNKFLEDCLSGNINNIFEKIKSSRNNHSSSANMVDGVSGRDNISSLFKDIYKNIYNKHDGNDALLELLDELNNNIQDSDLSSIDKITDSLIRDIINKLQWGKNDVVYNWGSDALKHGVNVLSVHLKNLFKCFLVHGHISQLFLFCALVPIVKNANKSSFSSDNYRLIAISSIILKILDHIILTLFDSSFKSSHMQFGFQKKCSTTMCTWTLLETINFFTNRGSSMFVCLLDLSKAFDHLKHDILFKKMAKHVPPIFVRLIIVSYICQSCSVKWDNAISQAFTVSNGVRQGAVASPQYFNIYLDDLFARLKSSGLGCCIDNFYYGILGYADDLALLSPSREALQKMLSICEKYFVEHGINISVDRNPDKSKTLCLAFNVPSEPARLKLYDLYLPWVKSAKHLGHLVHTDESSHHDVFQRRGEFIGKVHSLRQELGNQHPHTFMSLVQIYLSSMYGSNLWDLFSLHTEKLYTSWNILIRTTYNLHFATHRYIVYNIPKIPHIRISLLKRFVKFHNKLENSTKPEVRHLFNIQKFDCRSTFGRNCFNILKEYKIPNIADLNLNNIAMRIATQENDMWKINIIKTLLAIRDGSLHSDLSDVQVTDMLNEICIS